MMPEAPISFAGFHFDPTTGELTGPNGSTRLGPQPARVLAILVQRNGALVTRAELKDALWGNEAVEADMGLNTCIRQIRSALGDEADEGRFIETLPRRGYRFVAALDGGRIETIVPRRRRLYTVGGAAAAILIAVAGITLVAGQENRNVAILPLTPQPDDPAWVSDIDTRFTEQLVVQLTAHARGTIGVVGPATTARFATDPRPHTELGKALGVGYVMSGAVRPSDSTVFIQLVRVTDGVHVAAFRRRVVGVNLDTLAAAIAKGAAEKVLVQ